MATTIPNYEEAATVATESISGLDNLPNEVQHILNEICHLEKKCQDLHNDILRDQRRHIRDVIRPVPGNLLSGMSPSEGNIPPTPLPAKAHLPPRIAAAYAEIDTLSAEKIQLAERLILLLSRTQSRLDADVLKVRMLQGETVDDIRRSGRMEPTLSANISTATQVTDSIRQVLGGTAAEAYNTIALTPTSATPASNKKRRLTTQPSIKLTAPPPQASAPTTAYARSRPSRQTQATKLSLKEPEDDEIDAEGEDEFEGEGDDADEDTLYCFCQKQSYGEMIGCDGDNCPYQWFHWDCVGVKEKPADNVAWFCPSCIKNKAAPERRKGRKK